MSQMTLTDVCLRREMGKSIATYPEMRASFYRGRNIGNCFSLVTLHVAWNIVLHCTTYVNVFMIIYSFHRPNVDIAEWQINFIKCGS